MSCTSVRRGSIHPRGGPGAGQPRSRGERARPCQGQDSRPQTVPYGPGGGLVSGGNGMDGPTRRRPGSCGCLPSVVSHRATRSRSHTGSQGQPRPCMYLRSPATRPQVRQYITGAAKDKRWVRVMRSPQSTPNALSAFTSAHAARGTWGGSLRGEPGGTARRKAHGQLRTAPGVFVPQQTGVLARSHRVGFSDTTPGQPRGGSRGCGGNNPRSLNEPVVLRMSPIRSHSNHPTGS